MAVTAIVPTLGRSPWLGHCLAALRRAGGPDLRLVVVAQGAELDFKLRAAIDDLVELAAPCGFSRAANAGLARAASELVALVNDDVVVEPGWAAPLCQTFAGQADLAAAQGVNLELDRPACVDGCGIAWNRALQAVQLGRGGAAPPASAPVQEIFGASATAVVYRRSALEAVRLPGGEIFDPRFGSYYEDVDLACRLRAKGFRAELVPAARALHAGSVTGRTLGWRLPAQITRNRLFTLARALGRDLLPALPLLAWTDAKAHLRALLAGRFGESAGIAAGWLEALAQLPRFAPLRAPALGRAALRRWNDGGRR